VSSAALVLALAAAFLHARLAGGALVAAGVALLSF